MNDNRKIIMYDSPEAAEIKNVTGWVSSNGQYWGTNEDSARYVGCTHRQCHECGEPTEKLYIYCQECRNKKSSERFNSLEKVVWDLNTPVCMWNDDKFFFDLESIEDYCDDYSIDPTTLQLCLCERVTIPYLGVEYFDDSFGDSLEDYPEDLILAVEKFNSDVIDVLNKDHNRWVQSDKAIILPPLELREEEEYNAN